MQIYREENIERLQELIGSQREVFVVMDEILEKYCQYFGEYYHFLKNFNTFSLKAIEKNKNLRTIEQIYEWLFENNASRNSLLIGFGGGIISDITGFVAATYNRGIECGFIPTTLLSQCDASLGGKNGCNFNGYKNLIGTIREPSWIFISSLFLRSLPERVKNEGKQIIPKDIFEMIREN